MFDAPTEEQLAELKKTYGRDMKVVEVEEMVFVLALPADDEKVGTEFKRFTDNWEAGKRQEAYRALFPAYCVFPEREVVDRVLKRRPGFRISLGQEVAGLLGVQVATVKKY